MISPIAEKMIHQVLTKKMSLQSFEQWLYEDNALELSNPELYFELISFDYSSENNLKNFYNSFVKYVCFHRFEADRIKEYLQSIINKDKNYADAISIMYDLYCDGYGFLGKLGMVYGFYLADYSTSLSNNNMNNIMHNFYPNIINDAQKVIKWLDEEKIVFKNEDNGWGQFEYDDFRSEAEVLQGQA